MKRLRRSYIDLSILDKEDIVNPYNVNVLNNSLAHYILENNNSKSYKDKVVLRVEFKFNHNKNDEENLERMIKSYFRKLERNKYKNIKADYIKEIFLLIVGIIMVLSSQIDYFLFNSILTIFLEISGTVAIWEAISSFVFTDSKYDGEYKNAKQIKNCEIEFK